MISIGIGVTTLTARGGGEPAPPAAPAIVSVTISPATLSVGDVATAVVVATGSPPPTAAHQWTLDGADIPGATGASYATTATGALRVRATASNGVPPDAGPVTSDPVTVGAASASSMLLLESGDALLLESGDKLLLEAA